MASNAFSGGTKKAEARAAGERVKKKPSFILAF